MDVKQIGQLVTKMPQIGLDNSKSDSGTVFSKMYQSAIDMIDETNSLQKNADQMSLDFAMGKIDSVHDVMIAQEKATIALQYTVQLRDSILDAYNEIMRMQI